MYTVASNKFTYIQPGRCVRRKKKTTTRQESKFLQAVRVASLIPKDSPHSLPSPRPHNSLTLPSQSFPQGLPIDTWSAGNATTAIRHRPSQFPSTPPPCTAACQYSPDDAITSACPVRSWVGLYLTVRWEHEPARPGRALRARVRGLHE